MRRVKKEIREVDAGDSAWPPEFHWNTYGVPMELNSYSNGIEFLFQWNWMLIPMELAAYSNGIECLFQWNWQLTPIAGFFVKNFAKKAYPSHQSSEMPIDTGFSFFYPTHHPTHTLHITLHIAPPSALPSSPTSALPSLPTAESPSARNFTKFNSKLIKDIDTHNSVKFDSKNDEKFSFAFSPKAINIF
jgi:hypothetical protein